MLPHLYNINVRYSICSIIMLNIECYMNIQRHDLYLGVLNYPLRVCEIFSEEIKCSSLEIHVEYSV